MGTLNQGILGGFSGKVGPVSGSSWKGIPVVKSRPASVAYPGTAAQVSQTGKMSGIVALAKPILSYMIKPLWDRFAVKQSGYNAFVSANIGSVTAGVAIDPMDLVFSVGSMTAIKDAVVDAISAEECVVTFDALGTGDPLALPTDLVYAMLMDDEGELYGTATPVQRSTGEISIPAKGAIGAGKSARIVLAAKAASGKRVSNSVVINAA